MPRRQRKTRVTTKKVVRRAGRRTVGKQAKSLGQWFTKPDVARSTIDFFRKKVPGGFRKFDTVVEPSAGEGAFYDLLPPSKRIGIDIDAAAESPYIKADFLEWTPPPGSGRILVIGNPPFGVQGSLALKFLNHALSFAGDATTVALILPATFVKPIVMNRVYPEAELVASMRLSDDSFVHTNKHASKLRTVFQIWRKTPGKKREKIKMLTTHDDFKFVSSLSDKSGFSLRRTGSNAGKVGSWRNIDKKTRAIPYYYIKPRARGVQNTFKQAQDLLAEMSKQSLNMRSLNRNDIITAYIQTKGKAPTQQKRQ